MGGKKSDAIKIAAAERRQAALRLRAERKSYRAIGKALGVSEAQAYYDVQREIARLNANLSENASTLRAIEDESLQIAQRAILSQVREGQDAAVKNWIRISESRRKLLGLDAPTRMIVYQAHIEELITALENAGIDVVATFEALIQEIASADAANPRP